MRSGTGGETQAERAEARDETAAGDDRTETGAENDQIAMDDGDDRGEILGVLLAGGTSARFEGGNKLLAAIDGDPIVRHAARSLAPAVDRTIAITGYEADRVRDAIADVVDETVYNPDYEKGQSRSVRRGALAAADRGAEAAVFLPGDMPCVDPVTVRRVVDAYRSGSAEIVVPVVDDRRGNPVCFGSTHFGALDDVSGDVGGRALFDREPLRRLAVDDPGIAIDVDTRTDLEALRRGDSYGPS